MLKSKGLLKYIKKTMHTFWETYGWKIIFFLCMKQCGGERFFHSRQVTSIMTKGARDIQLLPINFCYWVLLTACLTATHRWCGGSTHEIVHFIVHILKAMSRASWSWGIDLFGTQCAWKGSSKSWQTRMRCFHIMFCLLAHKPNNIFLKRMHSL